MLRSKQPTVAKEFSWGVHFELVIERDCDITSALFDHGAESVLAQLDAIRRCTCADDASTASAWVMARNKKELLQ